MFCFELGDVLDICCLLSQNDYYCVFLVSDFYYEQLNFVLSFRDFSSTVFVVLTRKKHLCGYIYNGEKSLNIYF